VIYFPKDQAEIFEANRFFLRKKSSKEERNGKLPETAWETIHPSSVLCMIDMISIRFLWGDAVDKDGKR
jgi:hypothetical protein